MANSSRIAVHYHPTRTSGAILGMLVFLAGIALVGSVFLMARGLFNAPPPLIPASAFPTPAPSASASTAKTAADASSAAPAATIVIGQALALFLEKLLLLLIMCVAGSVIASSGIHLFFKALAAPEPSRSDAAPPPSTP